MDSDEIVNLTQNTAKSSKIMINSNVSELDFQKRADLILFCPKSFHVHELSHCISSSYPYASHKLVVGLQIYHSIIKWNLHFNVIKVALSLQATNIVEISSGCLVTMSGGCESLDRIAIPTSRRCCSPEGHGSRYVSKFHHLTPLSRCANYHLFNSAM